MHNKLLVGAVIIPLWVLRSSGAPALAAACFAVLIGLYLVARSKARTRIE